MLNIQCLSELVIYLCAMLQSPTAMLTSLYANKTPVKRNCRRLVVCNWFSLAPHSQTGG